MIAVAASSQVSARSKARQKFLGISVPRGGRLGLASSKLVEIKNYIPVQLHEGIRSTMTAAKVPVRAGAAFFVFMLLGLSLASTANAQNPHAKIFGDWRIRCNSATGAPSKCQMFQNVVVKETGQPILQMVIAYINDVPSPVGVVTLPLGVYLPQGLTLQVDKGQTYEMAFEICSAKGCRVRFSIDDALLGTFKGGTTAEITSYNTMRKPVRIPISLKGFTAAVGQLR